MKRSGRRRAAIACCMGSWQELAGAMKSQMVYTSSYTDIGRSRIDVDAVQNAKMPLMLEKSKVDVKYTKVYSMNSPRPGLCRGSTGKR